MSDRVMPEELETEGEWFYAMRRVDGELMFGEYGWQSAGESVASWEAAEDESDGCDAAVEYELVKMRVETVGRRTYHDRKRVDDHPFQIDADDSDDGPICETCGALKDEHTPAAARVSTEQARG